MHHHRALKRTRLAKFQAHAGPVRAFVATQRKYDPVMSPQGLNVRGM